MVIRLVLMRYFKKIFPFLQRDVTYLQFSEESLISGHFIY